MSTVAEHVTPRGRRVERISPADLVQLTTDVGPVPMNVGAVLLLAPGGPGAASVLDVLAARLSGVARLRQRLATPPWGLGRPYWIEDEAFDVDDHLSEVDCPGHGDLDSLLGLAMDAVIRPLDRSRPPWRAHVVTGLAGGQAAIVIVLHHVLADGIGGLAVLRDLMDGGRPEMRAVPVPAPGRRDLLVDAVVERARLLRGVPGRVGHLRRGRSELGPHRGPGAPRTSLNAPTGPRRALGVVEVALEPLRGPARGLGATINDVLVVAATGAMARVLRERGEHPQELVISVPISARTSTTGGELGNQVGVMPVRSPVEGAVRDRLTEVARATGRQKGRTRGASAALVGPVFRVLAAVGLFRWFVDRQRLVNSFLTNLRGPAEPMSFAGMTVQRLLPITITAGNVGVAFAALSYAGRLSVTVITDPDLVPESGLVVAALAEELAAVARA